MNLIMHRVDTKSQCKTSAPTPDVASLALGNNVHVFTLSATWCIMRFNSDSTYHYHLLSLLVISHPTGSKCFIRMVL